MYKTALEMLNNLLLHIDARVLQAVANACVHLLQTNIARENTGMKRVTHTNKCGISVCEFSQNVDLLISFRFTEERSLLDVFRVNGPVKRLITEPKNAIALLSLFDSNEKLTHTVWIKKFTILLLQQLGDEHLAAVASLQVIPVDSLELIEH